MNVNILMKDSKTDGLVVKILRRTECAQLVQELVFQGSPVDLADGFIHLSTPSQAAETAAKHFAGESGLWLAAANPAGFAEALKWEPSRGGALFPHLYRELRAEDLLWIRPLPLGPEGRHLFPDLAA